MHILLVHQYFLGRDDAGGSRWNQFARYWAEAGHRVTVLAGTVHYATGTKDPRYKGRYVVREQEGPGVEVLRCHVSESYNRSFLGRYWGYLSFALSSTYAGLFRADRPDVILATSPPLTVALTMRVLKACLRARRIRDASKESSARGGMVTQLRRLFRRVPCVFEVRDLWPETAVDTGVMTSRPLIWLSYRLEAMAYRASDRINVLTPAFVDALVAKKGIPPERISMIPNGADLDLMQPGERNNAVRRELGLGDAFVVSYFGAHGRANRVGQLLDVAERVKTSAPEVRFMLVGDGMEKPALVDEARRRGLDNVIFVDAVPKARVSDYINASDVCTAVLMKNDTFKTVYPNKIFDYMSCARAIIVGIDGVARRLVADAGAGLYAEPENTDAYVEALLALRNDPARRDAMGRRGYDYVREHFARDRMAKQYLELIEAVVQQR